MPQCAHKWLLRLLLLFLYFRGHYTWDRPTRRHRPMSEATSERKDKPTLLVFNAPAVTAAERAAAFFRYYGLAASVLRWCYHPSLLLYCYHPNQSFTYITLKVSWSSKLFEKFNAEKKAWLEKWGHFFWARVAKNILLFPLLPSSLLAAVINANEIAVLNTIGEKKEKKAPTVMVCFLSSLHPRSKK